MTRDSHSQLPGTQLPREEAQASPWKRSPRGEVRWPHQGQSCELAHVEPLTLSRLATNNSGSSVKTPPSRDKPAQLRELLKHEMVVVFMCDFFGPTAPCMWDLSSLTRDRTCGPMNWKAEVLTTGLLGKSQNNCSFKPLFWSGLLCSKR